MSETIREIAGRIQKLEVQGARNVAIAAIKAIETLARNTSAKSRDDFIKELLEARDTLFASRETEPLMRNALRWIIRQVEKSGKEDVDSLARLVSSSSRQFLEDLEASEYKITWWSLLIVIRPR